MPVTKICMDRNTMDVSLPRPSSSQQLIEEEYNIQGVCTVRLLKQNPSFDGVDPYFFEHGIAGGTAFMVWEASWTLIELLKLPPWRDTVHGATVVELGSGCGLVGLVAASLGAHVLLTDLPTIVNSILMRNLHLNINSNTLDTISPSVTPQSANTDRPSATSSTTPAPGSTRHIHQIWGNSVPVGLGTAAVVDLDWDADTASQLTQASPTFMQACSSSLPASPEVPSPSTPTSQEEQPSQQDATTTSPTATTTTSALSQKLQPQQHAQSADSTQRGKKVDLILAVDTVWLRSLLPCFTHTVACILRLQTPGACQCLLAFADRVQQGVGEEPVHNEGGRFFSTRQDVFAAFEAEGCSIEVISEGHLTQDVDKLPVVVARIWMP